MNRRRKRRSNNNRKRKRNLIGREEEKGDGVERQGGRRDGKWKERDGWSNKERT
jgi:hypothetical protein